jgi:hypothetical protein
MTPCGAVPFVPRDRQTSTGDRSRNPGTPHRAAADRWLTTAPGPAARTPTIAVRSGDGGDPATTHTRFPAWRHDGRESSHRAALSVAPRAVS